MKISLVPLLSLILASGLLSGGLLHAEKYEKIKPQEVPNPNKPAQLPKVVTPDAPANEAVVAEKLVGLVFLPNPSAVQKTGWKKGTGVNTQAVPLLEKGNIKAKAQGLLGRTVTMGDLNALFKEIILHYRTLDRPIVDVLLPEQEATNGIVQILVIEGKFKKTSVAGNKSTPAQYLQAQVRQKEGQPLSSRQLLNDLDWMSKNPFRKMGGSFTPGAQPGETDVILNVQEQKNWRLYSGWDNSGNDLTGDMRWNVGANWGHAFGLTDHQFNYQITANTDMDLSRSHSAGYSLPLPWRHVLSFQGSYSDSNAVSQTINSKGTSWQVGTRYEIPLETMRLEQGLTLQHNFFAGFDYKESNNDLDINRVRVSSTSTASNNFLVGYSGTLEDPYGSTVATVTGVLSPGGLAGNNNDMQFQVARARSAANYMVGKLDLQRTTKLPYDFSFIIRGGMQFADSTLIGGEQYSAGGFNTVRGYEESEISGDEGFLFSTELRAPAFSLGQPLGFTKANDQMVLLTFWDYAATNDHAPLAGSDDQEISGAGVGFRYAVSPYVSFRFDYGAQLLDSGFNNRHNSKGHFGLTVSY